MLQANDIFREILDNLYELEMGELEIPILDDDLRIPTRDDFLSVSFFDEETLSISFKGKTVTVKCDINRLKSDREYVARCIMKGFAQIVRCLQRKNESKMRNNTIRLTENKLRGMIREAVRNVLVESDEMVRDNIQVGDYIVVDDNTLGDVVQVTNMGVRYNIMAVDPFGDIHGRSKFGGDPQTLRHQNFATYDRIRKATKEDERRFRIRL